ncbi:MAG: nicotinate-nucleotide adenylyltransferase, partial [Pseudomonadota bacterium]|nr:nicotinate-nucleotide adenylyltransferase [Pseudomonadota bacterium]
MALRVFYGGTFDPIHQGHLAIARAARDALDAGVALMPAADPPHRTAPGADALQRARMLDLAVAGEPRLRVDRRELLRDGRSYSIDTLREIRAESGRETPLALLVGADSFLDLPEWKDWQALFELAHFVVADRPGNPLYDELPEALAGFVEHRWCVSAEALRAAPAGGVFRLQQPLQAESATTVRQRIADGGPWRALVPPAVAEYIQRHGLYRDPP